MTFPKNILRPFIAIVFIMSGGIANAQTNDELEALSAAIANIAIEISDLNSSINGEKAKQINLRSQMDALLLQISKKELELNSLKENQSASTSGLADVQNKKTQLQTEFDRLEGKKVLLSLQVEQLAPQVQATDTVLNDLDTSILKRSSQVTVLNKNISALKLQKEAFEKRINSNNQKITEIRILMQNKHKPLSTFNNIRNQVFALDMTVDNLEKQIEDMDEAVVGAEGKLNRFERACRREPACKDALNLWYINYLYLNNLVWSRKIDLYLWAIAVITAPVLHDGEFNYQFVNKTYNDRMECEVDLHKFILKNKPFSESQVVRCEKVDSLNDGEGKFFKQEDIGK